MIKFVVAEEEFEYRESSYLNAEEAYLANDNHHDKIIKICNTLEEAREILSGINVSSFNFNSPVGRCVQATVAYIAKYDVNVNDDGSLELVQFIDHIDFKY